MFNFKLTLRFSCLISVVQHTARLSDVLQDLWRWLLVCALRTSTIITVLKARIRTREGTKNVAVPFVVNQQLKYDNDFTTWKNEISYYVKRSFELAFVLLLGRACVIQSDDICNMIYSYRYLLLTNLQFLVFVDVSFDCKTSPNDCAWDNCREIGYVFWQIG